MEPTPVSVPLLPSNWQREVRRLAADRNAIVLAHNYQRPEIQDVADAVGDSLQLARIGASSGADTIVLCGVRFMAETAKLLSPDKTVLLPHPGAGCSLADTITAADVRRWRAEHPDAVVVAYVNTSVEVKALADMCCTSSNAVEVVRGIDPDREVLFLPDQFLGEHVRRQTGRTNLHVWLGECHVHAAIDPTSVRATVAANPDADLLVHPECGCTTSVLYLASVGDLPADRTRVLSTGAMVEVAAQARPGQRFLIATETGILHQLAKANPDAVYLPVDELATCRYMQLTTPSVLLDALRRGTTEITVDPAVAEPARRAVEAMVAVGAAPTGGE